MTIYGIPVQVWEAIKWLLIIYGSASAVVLCFWFFVSFDIDKVKKKEGKSRRT